MKLNKLISKLKSLTSLDQNVAIVFVGSALFLAAISGKLLLRIRWYLKKRRYPRDVVILHQNVYGLTFGPKGKIPFITFNGRDIADSQFCIEFLSKHFNKDLSKDHSSKDLGAARAFLKMTEESLFWVLCLSRFVYDRNPKYFGMSLPVLWFLTWYYRNHFYYQGYGRHTKDELFLIGKTDLKALNDFLQGKKFLIGDKPCNEDASVFGMVVQFVYTERGTLNKFIMSECPNIVAYVENMKSTFWPDWDNCITKKTIKNKSD